MSASFTVSAVGTRDLCPELVVLVSPWPSSWESTQNRWHVLSFVQPVLHSRGCAGPAPAQGGPQDGH